MNETETSPNMVTKYLGQFSMEILEPNNIVYFSKRTGEKRLIKFKRNDSADENDGSIAI